MTKETESDAAARTLAAAIAQKALERLNDETCRPDALATGTQQALKALGQVLAFLGSWPVDEGER